MLQTQILIQVKEKGKQETGNFEIELAQCKIMLKKGLIKYRVSQLLGS